MILVVFVARFDIALIAFLCFFLFLFLPSGCRTAMMTTSCSARTAPSSEWTSVPWMKGAQIANGAHAQAVSHLKKGQQTGKVDKDHPHKSMYLFGEL